MTPPGQLPLSKDLRSLANALDNLNSDPTFRAIGAQTSRQVKQATGVDISGIMPSAGEAAAFVRGLERSLGESRRTSSHGENNCECQVPAEYSPVEISHSERSEAHSSAHHEFVWVQSSKAENSQAMNLMARELMPNGTTHQDSLKVFCQDTEMGKMLRGEQQAGNGATLMLPKNQMKATLLAVGVKMDSPETANALSLMQTILPFAMSGETDAFRAVLQNFLQNLPATMDAKEFLGSMLEAFHQSGLGSLPEMKDLMLAMIKESGLPVEFAESFGAAKLSLGLKDMALGGIQLNGVGELLGLKVSEGLNQILQPLMRILTGLFFMKTETPLPKMLPDEKLMSELAAFFAAKSQAPKKEKDKRARKDKKGFFGFRNPGLLDEVPEQDEETAEEESQNAACY